MFIGFLSGCTAEIWGRSLASKFRPTLEDINPNETLFYPFTVRANKCSGNCNTINDPYTQVCVPNKVKNLNVKVFNLMTGVN